jgi:hypothetical protein
MKIIKKNSAIIFIDLLISIILFGSCTEFFDIANGSGKWWNNFSLSWALIFLLFSFTCLMIAFGLIYMQVNGRNWQAVARWRDNFIDRAGVFRWLLFFAALTFPILFFQLSFWGLVFQGLYFRTMVWSLVVLLLVILVSKGKQLIDWPKLLGMILLTAGIYAIMAALRNAPSYPFSLGWSEGNRLWDYSVMFGRDRYIYPDASKIYVFLDKSRQFIGGLPFLFPGLTIKAERIWVGLTGILPYLIFGMILFGFENKNPKLYLALVVWAYLFLLQGPIHPPIVLSAALIAAAWYLPLWAALPLAIAGGGFAAISRYTWMFAPAMWITMLESSKINGAGTHRQWFRLIVLGLAALAAGVIGPGLQDVVNSSGAFPVNVQEQVSAQPLIWSRLLPNSSYAPGILLGLFVVAVPLLLLAYRLAHTKVWVSSNIHKFLITSLQFAFLGVGLIISTKIGGGGDLHNLDMFLLGAVFAVALIWKQGGREWILNSGREPLWIKILLVFVLATPALSPLKQMFSYNHADQADRLMALTDTKNPAELDLYPSQQIVENSLQIIRSSIEAAQPRGEVLFMDQRQLLTFGFIAGVPLVPEYDKKLLIEKAFGEDRQYFAGFYSDLENKRFSLIITSPLILKLQTDADIFSDENNYWVKWVARPLLCYYDKQVTLQEVGVQLLIPKPKLKECPTELQ